MFERILFAMDLSDASELALECVARWKSLGLANVTVAHDVARESPVPVLVVPAADA